MVFSASLSYRSLWTPSNITTSLWLDATDSSTFTTVSGAVSQWDDKSGNGRNATQSTAGSRPALTTNVINGYSVPTFDAVDDHLIVSHASDLNIQVASNAFVFAVYKKNAGFRIAQKDNSGGTYAYSFFMSDSAVLSVAGGYTTEYANNTNTWTLDCGTWDGSIIRHYRNGSQLTPTVATQGTISNGGVAPPNTPAANTDPLYIGVRNNAGTLQAMMGGNLAVLIISNNALSTDNRNRLEGYYAHRLGLTANLPVSHPYKNNPPRGL